MKTIQLRAHHLFCLQGYQGYGYDEKFKINLEKILKLLKTEMDIKVVLTDSIDDICKSCPYLNEEKCISNLKSKNSSLTAENIIESNNKIVEMDLKILLEANLEKNKNYSYKELVNKINHSFSTFSKTKRICGECEWISKCLWIQSRKKYTDTISSD